MEISEKDKKRFWKKVNKIHPAECWEWKAYLLNGYGRISINKKPTYAHRVSYIIKYGKIPSKMIICHKCDNPSCVNPYHLYAGTNADNQSDRKTRGRNGNPDLRDEVFFILDKEYRVDMEYHLVEHCDF